MCQHVQKLAQTPEVLSQFDKCNLLEALMLLSNELCNYEKQSEFLTQMISPIIVVWLSDNMKMAISTPENFLNFVGLNEEANIEQSLNKNTYELMLCIHVIRGCVKRCKWPSDPDIAKKGNFVHPLSDSLKKIFYRNPAAQCIVPSLHQVFLLIRTLNALHNPAIQTKIHPSFLRALDISETDKYNILGTAYIDNIQRPKTIIERMNTFIHSAYDSCLHILGGSVENLSIDFYTVPSLSKLIMEGLFSNIQYMSDSR
ncbi:Exportin-5, partial [Stegodyphus mimosarum]